MEKPIVTIVEQHEGLTPTPVTKKEVTEVAAFSVFTVAILITFATVLFYKLIYPEGKKK